MSAFPAGQPGPKKAKEKLGPTHEIWDRINRHIRENYPAFTEEWFCSGKRYGWIRMDDIFFNNLIKNSSLNPHFCKFTHIRVLQNSTDNPAKSFKEIVAPTSACGDLAICECYDKQAHSLTAGLIRPLFTR